MSDTVLFHGSAESTRYAYFATCHSCRRISLHLSCYKIQIDSPQYYWEGQRTRNPAQSEDGKFLGYRDDEWHEFDNLDDLFFASIPTSSWAQDTRIPKRMRRLLEETQRAVRNNLFTGASATARKLVYVLAQDKGGSGANYEDRIHSLCELGVISKEQVGDLLSVQHSTSAHVHEESLYEWSADDLHLIIACLGDILHEVYVVPAERADRTQELSRLRSRARAERAKTDKK